MTENTPTEFGLRALYLFAKHVLPRLNQDERIIIEELLTLIMNTTQDLDTFIVNNKELCLKVYDVLYPQVDLSPTLTNYAGIVLGKMEDIMELTEDKH